LRGSFPDQGLQIGFEARTIVARVLKQELDQSPLAGAKVPMDTAAGQPMQERDRLLSEQFFKFFGGHSAMDDKTTS
jgi:hypothetical protein